MGDSFLQHFILNQYDSPFCLIDEKLNLVLTNQSFNGLFHNVSENSSSEKNNLRDLITDDQEYEQWKIWIDRTLKQGKEKFIYPVKSGEEFKVFEFKSYCFELDKVGYIAFIAHDATENKDFEKRLAQQNYELKKINNELDNFVYSVSHQIRAPLSSLLGLINVAKIDTSNKVNDYLDLMKYSIENLDRTVHEINDYSKNARLELRIDPIDFNEIWEKVIHNFELNKKLSAFKIIKNIENHEHFHSDTYRISLIVYNLLSNAMKFNDLEKKEPLIKVNIKATEQNAKITVIDNGEGMEENALPQIFNMFYRATRSARGAGLGLYIVKETIQKLKGDISVESKLGEGSKFSIELPNLKLPE